MSQIVVFSNKFDLYLVNLRIYLVLAEPAPWWLDGPNVECHFNLRQDRISNDVFCIQVTKIILLINRGWAQSTMATKTIFIPDSQNRGVDC
jgi:hypothetical protein